MWGFRPNFGSEVTKISLKTQIQIFQLTFLKNIESLGGEFYNIVKMKKLFERQEFKNIYRIFVRLI